MGTLSKYVNEAFGGFGSSKKITDYEEIIYKDGYVLKTAELEERFRLNCMYIFSNFGYMAPALKALTPIFTNEVDTMATDGIRLFMNPRFTMELNDTQMIFVLLHECMHNVLNHIMREKQAGHSDHNRSNIAADYEVNGILEDGLIAKGTTKSIGGYIDSKYDGWAYERIYADPNLDTSKSKPQSQPNGRGQGQQGQGQSGQGQQGQGQSGQGQSGQQGDGDQAGGSGTNKTAREAEVTKLGGAFIDKSVGEKIAKESGYNGDEIGVDENLESKWQNIGKKVAAGIGSGKGGKLGQLLDNIYKPCHNWKAELRKYIGHALNGASNINAWGRKMFLQNDEIRRYDKKASESLERVFFLIDTSGSNISSLELILSETHHIIAKKQIGQVMYVPYDDGALNFIPLNDPSNFKPSMLKGGMGGGGGTSFARAIVDTDKYIKSHKGNRKIDLMIVFTDGDTCEQVRTKPSWAKNVLFVITDRPSCEAMEWGKTIWINSEDVK